LSRALEAAASSRRCETEDFGLTEIEVEITILFEDEFSSEMSLITLAHGIFFVESECRSNVFLNRFGGSSMDNVVRRKRKKNLPGQETIQI